MLKAKNLKMLLSFLLDVLISNLLWKVLLFTPFGRLFNSVGDKKSLWANKVESHNLKQALNPFSDKFDKSLSRTMLNNKVEINENITAII